MKNSDTNNKQSEKPNEKSFIDPHDRRPAMTFTEFIYHRFTKVQ